MELCVICFIQWEKWRAGNVFQPTDSFHENEKKKKN